MLGGRPRLELVSVVANMAEAALVGVTGERPPQDHPQPPGPRRDRLRAPVDPCPGARQHRVHRPPVRPGRPGRQAGVATRPGRGRRRRPWPVGPLGRAPAGLPGAGRPGLRRRGRRDPRPGDLPPGPLLSRPVQAVGAGAADRHAGHRRRRRLRPWGLQRPAPAWAEEHHERGRAARARRPAAERGELRFPLPVGYVYDDDGGTVIDPDQEVSTAVADVFATFRARGSAYGVVAEFKGRRFPLRAYGGIWAGQLRWGRLTHSRVLGILANPAPPTPAAT